jgi:hypothetical protein
MRILERFFTLKDYSNATAAVPAFAVRIKTGN